MTGRFPFYSEESEPCEDSNCPNRWNERTWFGLQRFSGPEEIGISESLTTLAERLETAGYFTAGFVTNPHLKKRYHFDQGFALYREIFREESPSYGSGEAVTTEAIETLMDLPRQPFFLFLHYMEPHAPYLPAQEYQDLVGPLPDSGYLAAQIFKGWSVDTELLKGNEASAVINHARGLYDAEVRYVDDQIGKVLSALKSIDLYEDTLVVVTADHGEEFQEHGRMGHAGQLFDEVLRVPLIIKLPGREARQHAQLVRNFDVMPTLLDYAGIQIKEEGSDAASLRPIIENMPDSDLRFVYSSFPFVQVRRMYRNQNYKLIYYPEQPSHSLLFDLRADPEEVVNRYHSEPVVVSRLIGKLEQLSTKLRGEGHYQMSSSESEPDSETRRQLESLGYLQRLNDHADEAGAADPAGARPR